MRTSAYDEKAALEAVIKATTVLNPGIYTVVIEQAWEKLSHSNRETIELTLLVDDGRGNTRNIKDWLSNAPAAVAKTRHCCAACGTEVLTAFETGSVSQDMFPGHSVRVKLGIEKPRGYRPRNIVLDYMPADSSVVNFRGAR